MIIMKPKHLVICITVMMIGITTLAAAVAEASPNAPLLVAQLNKEKPVVKATIKNTNQKIVKKRILSRDEALKQLAQQFRDRLKKQQ